MDPSGFFGGYILSSATSVPEARFGGYILAKALDHAMGLAFFGGYIESDIPTVPTAIFGGYLSSIVTVSVPPTNLGGFIKSYYSSHPAYFGGYLLSGPNYTQFTELRLRSLVKARSENVVDQPLNIDAQLILKGVSYDNFNSKFIFNSDSDSDFSARLKVEKYRTVPSVQILSVTPSSGSIPAGQCKRVTVVASGQLGDGREWVNTQISFCDPLRSASPRVFNTNMSISGFSGPPPWTAFHEYCYSGVYHITVRGQDNLGMVGMDVYRLNLASGINEDFVPTISISGVPRFGEVPQSLQVDYSAISSGIAVPPATVLQQRLSRIEFNTTDRRILWMFGNRELSTRINPTTYYSSPGNYTPILYYLYTHPNGSKIVVSDTLRLGYLL